MHLCSFARHICSSMTSFAHMTHPNCQPQRLAVSTCWRCPYHSLTALPPSTAPPFVSGTCVKEHITIYCDKWSCCNLDEQAVLMRVLQWQMHPAMRGCCESLSEGSNKAPIQQTYRWGMSTHNAKGRRCQACPHQPYRSSVRVGYYDPYFRSLLGCNF